MRTRGLARTFSSQRYTDFQQLVAASFFFYPAPRQNAPIDQAGCIYAQCHVPEASPWDLHTDLARPAHIGGISRRRSKHTNTILPQRRRLNRRVKGGRAVIWQVRGCGCVCVGGGLQQSGERVEVALLLRCRTTMCAPKRNVSSDFCVTRCGH